MAYVEKTNKINTQVYAKIARNINAVGLRRLKTYCETKPHPVLDFDRDIRIIKLALTEGLSACVVKFSISRQRAEQIVKSYGNYAINVAIKNGIEYER